MKNTRCHGNDDDEAYLWLSGNVVSFAIDIKAGGVDELVICRVCIHEPVLADALFLDLKMTNSAVYMESRWGTAS